MEQQEWETMRKEIAALKKQVAMMQELQTKDFNETHKIIKEFYTNTYQKIADLYDIVWPIEDKVLPNARVARQELKSILGSKKLGAGKVFDEKKGG